MFTRSKSILKNIGWVKSDSGCDVRIFQSINDIPEREWSRINSKGNFFTSHSFLSTFEQTAPVELQCVYVLVRHDNAVVGAYIFQIIHLTPEVLSLILQPLSGAGKIVSGLTEWLSKCKEQKGMRVLISGNNFISGEHGVIAAEEFPLVKMFRLFPKVVQLIIEKFADPVKVSLVLAKDYYADKEIRPDSVLKSKRYYCFKVEPEMIVHIDPEWETYADYEKAMSKKYRNRSRSVQKKSCVLEVKDLTADEIFAHRYDIFSLYMAVHSNARFRLAALTPEYFVQMKRDFPAEFALSIYTLDGKIVAFRSGFVNGEEYEAHFIGLDYTLNRDKCLYQRILYDFVNDAIQNRSSQLLLGRTAAEIKSTVGAVPHDLECYMRHRNSISNHIISPFIDYLKPVQWIQRKPFGTEE
ncbi:MAG: hypothetical protein L6Q81_07665 [Bacteroidia bacterium]|nr:hypothetical protein [Bacteroidia bacterium]